MQIDAKHLQGCSMGAASSLFCDLPRQLGSAQRPRFGSPPAPPPQAARARRDRRKPPFMP